MSQTIFQCRWLLGVLVRGTRVGAVAFLILLACASGLGVLTLRGRHGVCVPKISYRRVVCVWTNDAHLTIVYLDRKDFAERHPSVGCLSPTLFYFSKGPIAPGPYGNGNWSVRVDFPLWSLVLPSAAYPALLLFLQGRRGYFRRNVNLRRKHSRCEKCGYPKKGNTSGVCPECGQPFTRET